MATPPQKGFLLWYARVVAMNVIPALLVLYLLKFLPPPINGFVRWQLEMGWERWLVTFLAWAMAFCFIEWFFHRYFLHKRVFPGMDALYHAHEHHHGLTPIRLDKIPGEPDSRNRIVINHYPIETEDQLEDAAFPENAIAKFWLAFSVPMVVGQWLIPSYPVVLAGMLAIVWALVCYETFHSLFHRQYEWWEQAIQQPHYGPILGWIYSVHHYHHANKAANEAIGGFFGFPLADLVLGTLHIPKRLLIHHRIATVDEVKTHQPSGFVRWMDRVTSNMAHRRGS